MEKQSGYLKTLFWACKNKTKEMSFSWKIMRSHTTKRQEKENKAEFFCTSNE